MFDITAPWFFCADLHSGLNELDAEEAHHATAAKRLEPQDAVVLFDGNGNYAGGTLVSAGRHSLTVHAEEIRVQTPPGVEIAIAVAIPKAKRWQYLVEKLTEIGVTEIVPVTFARSIVSGSALDSAVRWAREACKQCRRAALPRLTAEISLKSWLSQASSQNLAQAGGLFLTAPDGEKISSIAANRPASACRRAACIIGPEGGLTAEETALCLDNGARKLALGPHILRIETAALAAGTLFMNW